MRNLCCAAVIASFSFGAWSQEEILPAVLQAPSSEGYVRSERGIERIKFDLIGGRMVVEGDIVLGEVDPGQPGLKGLVVRAAAKLWPGRALPYEVDPALQNRARVTSAIQHWRQSTGIEFIERTAANAGSYPNYVYFTNPKNDVCASMVGMVGGRQLIELADGCSTGATIHEIGHALGLAHEHTRSDRNDYVQVRLDRVLPGKEHNFNIRADLYTDTGAYDYLSIMHYSANAFSRDGQATIIPRGNQSIGQRNALSEGDIAAALRLYPRATGRPVCVTLLMLNQPFAEGIGDIDTTIRAGGTVVFDGLLPYRGPYGHFPFEIAKFWAPKGRHQLSVTSVRGKASLSTSVPVDTDTTAVQVMFWGQRNGQPHRSFTTDVQPYYDDIDDDIDCDTQSPTVGVAPNGFITFDSLGAEDDPRAPQPNWPIGQAAVQTFDKLVVPPGGVHKVPLGVVEYRINELVLGDEARIWLPYDKLRFTLTADRSTVGNKVQVIAKGGPGRRGNDATSMGGSGENGGPGANAPTLLLDLGRAQVGSKFRVYLEGGAGGGGGSGGHGRTGFDASCFPPESAKRGGNGGAGGYAGEGGAGGFLTFRGEISSPLEGFRAFVQGGPSDQGGLGGQGGRGGRGTNCGVYSYGSGDSGRNGPSRNTDVAGRVRGVEGRVFDEIKIVPIAETSTGEQR